MQNVIVPGWRRDGFRRAGEVSPDFFNGLQLLFDAHLFQWNAQVHGISPDGSSAHNKQKNQIQGRSG
jgi:hypothetical protein